MMQRRTLARAFAFAAACVFAQPARAGIPNLPGLHVYRGTVTLPRSGGRYTVPPGAVLVDGADATRVDKALSDGFESSDAEAVLFDGNRTTYIISVDAGYVRDLDWNDIQANALLADIRRVIAIDNARREAAQLSAIVVDGWADPPAFDRAGATATCIAREHDDTGAEDDGTAIVLGRDGYEMFLMDATAPDTARDRSALDRYVRAFSFAPGRAYRDHQAGDPSAAHPLSVIFRGEAGGLPPDSPDAAGPSQALAPSGPGPV